VVDPTSGGVRTQPVRRGQYWAGGDTPRSPGGANGLLSERCHPSPRNAVMSPERLVTDLPRKCKSKRDAADHLVHLVLTVCSPSVDRVGRDGRPMTSSTCASATATCLAGAPRRQGYFAGWRRISTSGLSTRCRHARVTSPLRSSGKTSTRSATSASHSLLTTTRSPS
jgi:hypothetical protein